MGFSIAELNTLSESALREHVDSVLRSLSDASAPAVTMIAPFVTADVLLRLHNIVVDVRNSSGGVYGVVKAGQSRLFWRRSLLASPV